jgi:hypothetical protein
MKKEPKNVKKFVKLLTKPSEDNSIDTQIDQFKALDNEKQNELLEALEKKPVTQDTGINLMLNYTKILSERFQNILKQSTTTVQSSINSSNNNNYYNISNINVETVQSVSNKESDEYLLNILLNEAQGEIRSTIKLTDLLLITTTVRVMESKLRFRLGVGLAKLGLFDLSLRHVWLSATPWEAPLYKLRAKLVFSPIHSSIRALASAVDNFENQGENILSQFAPSAALMIPICNSLNEAALALQSLPLLHLAGFASPRQNLLLGHSPVALPVLLSEIFDNMCPPQQVPQVLSKQLLKHKQQQQQGDLYEIKNSGDNVNIKKSNEFPRIFKLGIVSGSFDGIIGRIMIGK